MICVVGTRVASRSQVVRRGIHVVMSSFRNTKVRSVIAELALRVVFPENQTVVRPAVDMREAKIKLVLATNQYSAGQKMCACMCVRACVISILMDNQVRTHPQSTIPNPSVFSLALKCLRIQRFENRNRFVFSVPLVPSPDLLTTIVCVIY